MHGSRNSHYRKCLQGILHSTHHPQIHRLNGVKGVSVTFFGLAVTAATIRTFIRFRKNSRLALDDSILLFACICLTAATGLLYNYVPDAYAFEGLTFNAEVPLPFPISDLGRQVVMGTKIIDAYLFLSILVLFAVKLCFLFFFRALVDRVNRWVIYWRLVVMVTVIAGGFSVCEGFIACPYRDSRAGESSRVTERAY